MVKYNCKQIEELILKQSTEVIKKEELKLIDKHIANCASCKSFKLSLTKIEKNMQIENTASLQPNPDIKVAILNQIQNKSSKKFYWTWNISNLIRSIFEYRIPVYQAGLAMIIILIIVTFGMDITQSVQYGNTYSPTTIQEMGIPSDSEYIIDNHPDLQNQKVGVNAREDSILIGFIYTSM